MNLMKSAAKDFLNGERSREERCSYDDWLHPDVTRGSYRVQGSPLRTPDDSCNSGILAAVPSSSIQGYGGGVLTQGEYSNKTSGYTVLIEGHRIEGGCEY